MNVNPIKSNQVYFWQDERRLMGWIAQSTPTRYRIDYVRSVSDRGYSQVWRRKQDVVFVATGKKGSVKRSRAPKNPCPRPARQNVSPDAITRALSLSRRFHGFRARRLTNINLSWPKALVLLGHVVRLDYLSDKEDGKTRCYTHDFKQPVSVFASSSAKTGQKNILLLHGNFGITQEGIVG